MPGDQVVADAGRRIRPTVRDRASVAACTPRHLTRATAGRVRHMQGQGSRLSLGRETCPRRLVQKVRLSFLAEGRAFGLWIRSVRPQSRPSRPSSQPRQATCFIAEAGASTSLSVRSTPCKSRKMRAFRMPPARTKATGRRTLEDAPLMNSLQAPCMSMVYGQRMVHRESCG